MNQDDVRALARAIFGTEKPRGEELRSWLKRGEMSASQQRRLGRTDKPACFESEEQWVAWCMHEAVRPIVTGSSYCYDCTARYQARMLGNDRCEHPLTIFRTVGSPPVTIGKRKRPRRRGK